MVSELTAALLTVSGTVQGVGFRYYIRRLASALGLTGYVRNLDNGDVEITAEGPKAAIEELILGIKTREMAGYVADIAVEWIGHRGKYRDFSITL